MLRSHPLLDVDGSRLEESFVSHVFFVSGHQLLLFSFIIVLFEIGFEMLEQRHFLLEILRETSEIILRHHVLLLICIDRFSFIIVKLASAGFGDDLGGIVEKHTSTEI